MLSGRQDNTRQAADTVLFFCASFVADNVFIVSVVPVTGISTASFLYPQMVHSSWREPASVAVASLFVG